MIGLPCKKTAWGPVTTVEDLRKAVMKSGQPFGVDWSGPACEVDASFPCDKTYYQYLGFGLHSGIDIPVSTGTEIFAVETGKVVEISDKVTAGLGIVLYHQNLALKSVYWHLSDIPVVLGQIVQRGAFLAHSDNTGLSKGPHLHLEIKTTDKNGVTIKPVDPFLYFDNKMTEEQVKKIYALAFYRLPDTTELAFWTGKDLTEFLNTAIKDRASFLGQQ